MNWVKSPSIILIIKISKSQEFKKRKVVGDLKATSLTETSTETHMNSLTNHSFDEWSWSRSKEWPSDPLSTNSVIKWIVFAVGTQVSFDRSRLVTTTLLAVHGFLVIRFTSWWINSTLECFNYKPVLWINFYKM